MHYLSKINPNLDSLLTWYPSWGIEVGVDGGCFLEGLIGGIKKASLCKRDWLIGFL